jgi:hypothetical protein
MNRLMVPFLVLAIGACQAALLLGQEAESQHPRQLASEETVQRLISLSSRAEVPRELQKTVREGIQTWSNGEPNPLRKIDALLEVEESRMRASIGSTRQPDRVRLLRKVLRQVSGLDNSPAGREESKGLTGSIQGTLTDADSGLPLDFEFVEVYNALGDYVDQDLTDEGAYSIDDLPAGTYFVLTDTEDHLDELYNGIPCPKGACNVTTGSPVQVTPGGITTDIDFALAKGGRIIGTVTDAGSGLPLGFEFVRVFNALGESVGLDLTEFSGQFLVGGLPTGTYYALADARDHLDELYSDIPCPLTACNVTGGVPIGVTLGSDTTGIDFALDTGGRVIGNVTERLTGLPLDFEFVDLYNALGDRVDSGLTDSSGHYLIGGLPSGVYFAGTDTLGDYFDELYDDLPCPNESCDPTSGTPITVALNDDTEGIDFVLSLSGPSERPRLTELAGLILPIVVDLTNPEGRTTLFAVHNTTESDLEVKFGYHTTTVGDEPIRTDQITLGPSSTVTLNARNKLTGYDTTGLDQLAGLVLITQQGSTTAQDLIGDFFSLDSANDFASGDKLIRASDLCNRQRIRFVDFGSGTGFMVLLNEPRGAGTASFSYTAYNESGAMVGSGNFFTEAHLVLVDRSEFAPVSFGVLEVDFGNALGGQISATYSAFGRFSVGLSGECIK